MSTDPREFEHPIDGTTPNQLPTVLGVGSLPPPLVEVIAAALASHQWYDATTDSEDPATGCTGCDDWFGDENAVDDGIFAAHQARAVLAAISEAGAVEWAIFRKTADENALPFDWSAGKTYGQSMSRIERMYPRDRDQLQPRSRIAGPWTAVER